MTETDLDRAHAAMEAAPDDDVLRLAFFERLADGELFMLLEKEADGDNVEPRIFEVEEQGFVLVFDRIERLSGFAGDVTPYVSLSGRALAAMLAGQGIGIGLNLDMGPAASLLPPEAVDWLAGTTARAPEAAEGRIRSISPPTGLPEVLLPALDRKLATATGLAPYAYLVSVEYDGGTKGHLLGFVDAVPGAEGALAGAVGEALSFSGIEAGELDVAFFASGHPMTEALARQGLRFDLPERARPAERKAPGSDPDAPPRLR
ncbi:SseB family protein [Pelagovum pacificum]|uniref:SseB family protein n=1 Tax=Pelagovum pacificum TaxID=2588711 RepID=A0A5C5GCW7_9RHOB|nr:SseB family protein [Pelagovum pacificum]QQA42355.1 SseB family protein [Pelagovum pacificum]TNY31439.1 SseB family protein [Pelagovum pacificum]